MKAGYQERVRVQTLRWAMGDPYHNSVDNECCPDFSCCHPDMFEKDTLKRWRLYHENHGSHERSSSI
jgi:hypothetical protein